MSPVPAAYDLFFTGSRANPRQCVIIGEDVEPIFYRFETPEVFMTNTRTTVYRNQSETVATFDWTAANYLGLCTVKRRAPFPMSSLVQQCSSPNSRAFFLNGMCFEWRRRQDDSYSYDLYAPQNVRIATYQKLSDLPTPVGPAHGVLQYTFAAQRELLLEVLLSLCVNRWIDINGV